MTEEEKRERKRLSDRTNVKKKRELGSKLKMMSYDEIVKAINHGLELRFCIKTWLKRTTTNVEK